MSDTPLKTIEDAVRELGGVWPESVPSSEVLVWIGSGWTAWKKDWAGKSFNDWYEVCTRDEFEECTRQLRNEPSWNDAPDWAVAKAQDGDGMWCWYEAVPRPGESTFMIMSMGGVRLARKGEVIGDWRQTLRLRPKEKKMENKNDWYERGEFPPVGTLCEVLYDGVWEQTKIIGWDDEFIVVTTEWDEIQNYDGLCAEPSDFRPIQTERERWIGVAARIVIGAQPHAEPWPDTLARLARIYDAGLAKKLEGK